MGIQFFGEFLIDRWVITRGQLLEALELQEYRNLKFGALAVQKGFLTEEQVEQINDLQRSTDQRFGDLAIAQGVLSQEQVRELLTLQKNNYLYLGEALLELGHVTDDILERELTIFREEQARFNLDQVVVPEGVAQPDVLRACVDLTRKMFSRVVGLLIKVGEPELVPDESAAPAAATRGDYHLTVLVRLSSPAQVVYSLSASSDLSVAIASRILKEDATRESEEMVEDAVKEFCNIICGNAAAKLAQMGQDVEIGPPESVPAPPTAPAGGMTVRYPIHVAEGALDLRLLLPAASGQPAN